MGIGLTKTPFFVPLAAPLNSEVARKMLAPGSVLSQSNTTMDRTGQVIKRSGSAVLSTPTQATLPSGGTIPTPWNLATLNSNLNLLGVPGPQPVMPWLSDQSAYIQANAAHSGVNTLFWGPLTTSQEPVLASAYESTSVGPTCLSQVSQSCTANSFSLTAYESVLASSSNVVVQITDSATNRIVASNTFTNCLRPACITVGQYLVCIFADLTNTTVQIAQWDSLNLGTGAPVLNNVGNVFPTAPSMLTPHLKNSTTLTFLYTEAPSFVVVAYDWTPSTQTSLGYTLEDHNSANIPAANAVCWVQDFAGSGKTAIVASDPTTGVKVYWDFGAVVSSASKSRVEYVLDSSTSAKTLADFGSGAHPTGVLGIWDLACYTTSTNVDGNFTCTYTVANLYDLANAAVYRATRDGSVLTTGAAYWFGLVQTSNWFQLAGVTCIKLASPLLLDPLGSLDFLGTPIPIYVRTAPTSNTDFIVRDGQSIPAPMATINAQAGGGLPIRNSCLSLTSVNFAGDTIMATATLLDLYELTSDSILVPVFGVSILTVHAVVAGEVSLSPAVEAFGGLMIPGGTLMYFDGQTLAEADFATSPPPLLLVAQNDGGELGGGTYYYDYQYAYRTVTGRVRKSAFSSIGSVATVGGMGKSTHVTGHYLNATGWPNGWIEVYRTPVNSDVSVGTNFQLVRILPNNPNGGTFTFSDLAPDNSLGASQYGGDGTIVDNSPIGGVRLLAVFQNRLWFVSPDYPQTLYYTDQDTGLPGNPNDGLVFNINTFALDVLDANGPITGLQAMDTELVVFKKDAVYAVTGSGPDPTGANSNYNWQLVAEGVGCSNPHSLALAQDGTWFMSESKRSGIMTLSRGLTVDYSGQGVRDFSGLSITSAVVVPSLSQIRFYSAEGTTLCWDWISKIWSTFTGQPCACAVYFNGTVTYAPLSGTFAGYVLQETAGYYAEGLISGRNIVTDPTDAANSTGFVMAGGNFTTADVGRQLLIYGTGYSFINNSTKLVSNDGVYTVASWGNNQTITTTPAPPLAGTLATGYFSEVSSGRINMDVDSPWLSFANLRGWQRTYQVQPVGDTAGSHILFLNSFRGYSDTDQTGYAEKLFDTTVSAADWTSRLKQFVTKMDSLKLQFLCVDKPNTGQSYTVNIPVVVGTDGANPSGFIGLTNIQSYKVGDVLAVSGDTNGNNGTYTITGTSLAGGIFAIVSPSAPQSATFSAGTVVTQTGFVLAPTTAGPIINGVTLVVGVKKGAAKVPSTVNMGGG